MNFYFINIYEAESSIQITLHKLQLQVFNWFHTYNSKIAYIKNKKLLSKVKTKYFSFLEKLSKKSKSFLFFFFDLVMIYGIPNELFQNCLILLSFPFTMAADQSTKQGHFVQYGLSELQLVKNQSNSRCDFFLCYFDTVLYIAYRTTKMHVVS